MCQAARMRRSGTDLRRCRRNLRLCAAENCAASRTCSNEDSGRFCFFASRRWSFSPKSTSMLPNSQRGIAGVPLPGVRIHAPSPACAQRHGACRRHIPRRTQMEAAGWAPAAGFFANTCASSCLIACNRASGCAAAHASQHRRCPTPSAAVCPLSAAGGPVHRPAIRSVHPPARSGAFVWPPPACPGRSRGGPPDGPPLPINTETIQQEV